MQKPTTHTIHSLLAKFSVLFVENMPLGLKYAIWFNFVVFSWIPVNIAKFYLKWFDR